VNVADSESEIVMTVIATSAKLAESSINKAVQRATANAMNVTPIIWKKNGNTIKSRYVSRLRND
jgi:hypothetical protein